MISSKDYLKYVFTQRYRVSSGLTIELTWRETATRNIMEKRQRKNKVAVSRSPAMICSADGHGINAERKTPEYVAVFVWHDTPELKAHKNHIYNCEQCQSESETANLCEKGRNLYSAALNIK